MLLKSVPCYDESIESSFDIESTFLHSNFKCIHFVESIFISLLSTPLIFQLALDWRQLTLKTIYTLSNSQPQRLSTTELPFS
jgi:hypothetical protein